MDIDKRNKILTNIAENLDEYLFDSFGEEMGFAVIVSEKKFDNDFTNTSVIGNINNDDFIHILKELLKLKIKKNKKNIH